MAPIRTLQIITRLIVGGAQETVMATASWLDKERFSVTVLSGSQTGSEGSLIEEIRARGVDLVLLPEMVREISPLKDLSALWKLVAYLRRERFTVVHTNSSKAGILGRIAARLAGTPVIVHTVHGWSFHDYMSPLGRGIYILLERLTAPLTDALVAVTRQDIQKGLAHHIGRPEQYSLIRSAISLREFDPVLFDRDAVRRELGIDPQAVVIGNIGRFSAQKNPLDWVRVADLLAQRHPQVHFLLVGDGPLRPQVESLIAELGLQQRFTLAGLRRDPARMFSAIDIFLLTSLWEGLPRVLPQALAMGVPVVANQADGALEAIQPGETGFLCPPGDLQQMAGYCSRLIDDFEPAPGDGPARPPGCPGGV